MTTPHTPSELAKNHTPAPSAASALIGDPSRFGFVGEDGTVFVKTPN
jgi:hypothetical protein